MESEIVCFSDEFLITSRNNHRNDAMDVYTNLMTGSADDGREDGTGCVISGETGFAHTGAIVDNQSCYIIVTHFDSLGF